MSYKVIEMKGPDEPWWQFEGWESYITQCREYTTLTEAKQYYRKRYRQLAEQYEHVREKNQMVAFWNDGEWYHCEDCADDTQCYYGLLITQDET